MTKAKGKKRASTKPSINGLDKRSMPRRFLNPSIMLLLAEEPSHGYALLDKLVAMGVAEKRLPLPLIYRALTYLEVKRMAGFQFKKHEGRGPARKIYHLTNKGRKELASWSESMEDISKFIDGFQERYEKVEESWEEQEEKRST
jgi:PadR family transcriptional regulator PadR